MLTRKIIVLVLFAAALPAAAMDTLAPFKVSHSTTPTTKLLFVDITATTITTPLVVQSTINATGNITGSNLSGTNTGDVTLQSGSTEDILGLSGQVLSFDQQSSATFLAGPGLGIPAAPAFRAITEDDLPDLSGIYQPYDADLDDFAGLTAAQGDLIYGTGTGTWGQLAKNASATRYLSNTGTSNNPAWAQVDLANGVIDVLQPGNGGTGAATTSANLIFAGPTTGIPAAGSFRSMVDADIPSAIARDAEVPNVTLQSGATQDILGLSTQELSFDVQTAATFLAAPALGVPAAPAFRGIVETDLPDLSGTYQPLDADLTDLGGLTAAAGDLIYGNGTGDWAKLASAVSGGKIVNAILANSTITFTDGAGLGGSGSPTALGGTYTVSATTATPQFAGLKIGSASLDTAVHVSAISDNNDGLLKLVSSNSNNAGVTMWCSGAATMLNWQISNNYKSAGGLSFMRSTTPTGVPTTGAVEFDTNGQVGINDASPTERLTVNGDVSIYGGTLQVAATETAAVVYNRFGGATAGHAAAATDLLASIGEFDGVLYADAGLEVTGNITYTGILNGSFNIDTTATFDKTDTTLANITLLSVSLAASGYYHFRAHLPVQYPLASGYKVAMSGTCTATSMMFHIQALEDAGGLTISAQKTALDNASGYNGTGSAADIYIEGWINVANAGTLTVQFAQNLAAGGTSQVMQGATFNVEKI